MAARLAMSPVSRPASDRVTEYEANTGRKTMTYLNVFQHYKPENQSWTEEATNINVFFPSNVSLEDAELLSSNSCLGLDLLSIFYF